MITVRFPTGFSISYAQATYREDGGNGAHRLRTEKDGAIVARVPRECLIEFQEAHLTQDAGLTIDKALRHVAKHPEELRRLTSWNLKQLKAALDQFDARRGCWKDS